MERDLLPMSRALDLAVTAWSPLGMGVLTGKYGDGRATEGDARLHVDAGGRSLLSERNLEIAREVGRVAAELGASPAQVAIAWLRALPVSSCRSSARAGSPSCATTSERSTSRSAPTSSPGSTP
jgi:aryl-alcohol dehydrogenase-like predicted oxidoreductase